MKGVERSKGFGGKRTLRPLDDFRLLAVTGSQPCDVIRGDAGTDAMSSRAQDRDDSDCSVDTWAGRNLLLLNCAISRVAHRRIAGEALRSHVLLLDTSDTAPRSHVNSSGVKIDEY